MCSDAENKDPPVLPDVEVDLNGKGRFCAYLGSVELVQEVSLSIHLEAGLGIGNSERRTYSYLLNLLKSC